MQDQKNIVIAVVLSLAIILGFQFLWPADPTPPPAADGQTATSKTDQPAPSAPSAAAIPAPDGGGSTAAAPAATQGPRDRAAALAEAPRVAIDTPALTGSLSLRGARIDDLTLREYRTEVDPASPAIVLLSPQDTPTAYYAEFGFVAGDKATPVPGPDTPWQADGATLTPDSPVTLTWDNGQGLRFTRVVSVDAHYMFTIRDRVENSGVRPATIYPYGLISRGYRPQTLGYYILHEGPLGVFDGTLKEVDYKDLENEDNGVIGQDTVGGWIGITDKYWLTAIDLDNDATSKTRFVHTEGNGDRYQVDYRGEGVTIRPGDSVDTHTDFFAGAKRVQILDKYAKDYGITNFDLAVDFGWFYFLTKPFFYAIQFLYGILGNFGLAIMAFTLALRLLMFPLANKSFKSMSAMKKLQPEMKKIQERFADDKPRQQQEMMALYKREKVNPVSGCLPIAIQIPIFFSLYKVLFVSLEMRHAPFFGWIKDLSAPDPTTFFNLFGLIPWDPPSFLHIGVWPLIMGLTMWLQQKLNPAPADPMQAKIMMFLPVVFTIMLAGFPAGLVIYWATNNLLSMTQQWVIMRRMGVSA
jgi:YidC/Oxa1 family membrane protein insertase